MVFARGEGGSEVAIFRTIQCLTQRFHMGMTKKVVAQIRDSDHLVITKWKWST